MSAPIGRAALFSSLLACGCLGDVATIPPDAAPPADLSPARDAAVADLSSAGRDAIGGDLAGLVDCFGVAVCDPSMDFCLRFHDGSPSVPGKLTAGPACFDPTDPCADQGQPMDCNCIQNDVMLGANCAGACVDHGDGTFDCYAQM